jgi:hypothetical protein
MSVKVDLAELATQLESFGFAYLLTVGDELRPHAVAVRPVLGDDRLSLDGLGRRTRDNLAARPDVTLVWPPVEEGGYTLIVDGRAAMTDAGATVDPIHAVLHRPADHGAPAGTTGCGNDCVPVGS